MLLPVISCRLSVHGGPTDPEVSGNADPDYKTTAIPLDHGVREASNMDPPHPELSRTNDSSRTPSLASSSEEIDYLDLPIRELNDNADLREYTTETRSGEIIRPVKSNVTGQIEDWKLVTFTIDDPENPKNWSKLYKWYCTMVVAFTCFVVAFASSVITAKLEGPMESFGVTREVSFVVVTVFVVGFGVGKQTYDTGAGRRLISSCRSHGLRTDV